MFKKKKRKTKKNKKQKRKRKSKTRKRRRKKKQTKKETKKAEKEKTEKQERTSFCWLSLRQSLFLNPHKSSSSESDKVLFGKKDMNRLHLHCK